MQPMHQKTTRAMAAAYGFDASKNAEIRGSWYRLCLQAGPPPADRYPAPGKRMSWSDGTASR
jgi:Leukotriene A4 hydrolase, C-terminal